jgi:hypothetical protein
MIEVATASINTFGTLSPKADFVPPSDQLITLTYSQLQDLIREATEPLREEIQDLKEEVAQDRVEFDRFKATHKAFAVQTTNDIDQLFGAVEKTTEPTKKTTDRVETLHRLMLEEKTQQVSIAKAARLLGLTKERVRQLKPLILADGRFEIGWSNLKGQKGVVIRIRQYLR